MKKRLVPPKVFIGSYYTPLSTVLPYAMRPPHLVALKTRICSGAETNFTLVVRARPYLSSSCGRCHASVMHVPHVRTEMLLIAFTISFKHLLGGKTYI